MLPIDYMVLFLLMLVVLVAVIIFVAGVPWPGLGGYGEVYSCCGRYRANGCEVSGVTCDSGPLSQLMVRQNVTEEQLMTMCDCGE